MCTDLLDGYCARFRPKLIYTVPTFQNPTGTTLSPERRSELIDVARRYQCLIVETMLTAICGTAGNRPTSIAPYRLKAWRMRDT